MKITKIQSLNNNNQLSTNNRNVSPSYVSIQSSIINKNFNAQPSFQGWSDALGKLLRRNKPSLIATEIEAIRALAQLPYGAYGLTPKGYKLMTGEEFLALSKKPSMTEIIIKHPQTETHCDTDVSSEKSIWRQGVAPSSIIDAIKRKLKKMIFMTDNELHVLTFPERDLNYACDAFEATDHIPAELQDTVHLIPEVKTNFLYSHTQEMLDDTSSINHGIKLERIPLAQVVNA